MILNHIILGLISIFYVVFFYKTFYKIMYGFKILYNFCINTFKSLILFNVIGLSINQYQNEAWV